ncbi:MAG: substrate-binding domain-containing protein [Oscillospiraceae bacterium]|nr:substrate-binding domain-containing protein [Oscillospiraceae bacterium]
MKKWIALLLAAVMVLGLVACSSSTTSTETTAASAETTTAAAKTDAATTEAGKTSGDGITIAMLPKFKGENYFDACKVGAQEAVDEIGGITFLYDGPPQNDATNQHQVDILEGWIAQGVDVIIVSPNDPDAITATLEKAQAQGIKVLTYDADANDGRDFFVNQVTADGVAAGLIKGTAEKLQAKGYGPNKSANIAIVSSAETDANQNSWIASMKTLLATSEYSWMKLADGAIYYPGPAEDKNQEIAATLVGSMGEGDDQYQAVIGITSMATPALGAAYEAAANKPDASKVVLTGLATPNAIKDYILNEDNPLDAGVLWNCMDLGYLAVQTGYQYATGALAADATSITAGRLGAKDIKDSMVILGDALVFDASNVENFNY